MPNMLKYKRRHKRKIGQKTYRIKPPDEKRSNIMAKIPRKKTSIEILFTKELRKNKIKYRSGEKLFGKPDFIIFGHKIAIFCDGDFWHGYNFKEGSIKNNSAFWNAKIKRNIERDKEVNKELRKRGWIVIRFWEHDIKRSPEICIKSLMQRIKIL